MRQTQKVRLRVMGRRQDWLQPPRRLMVFLQPHLLPLHAIQTAGADKVTSRCTTFFREERYQAAVGETHGPRQVASVRRGPQVIHDTSVTYI